MKMWEQFDMNEISLLILNAGAYAFVLLLANGKKFTPQITAISLLWGFTVGILYDFTIGGGLLDFYKENDTNRYEGADVLYHLLYAPFGYYFFYFYETLGIRKKTFLLYVAAWAVIGVGAQWLFTVLNIITLQKGYRLAYSFPIFLVTQSLTGIYIELLKKREAFSANRSGAR